MAFRLKRIVPFFPIGVVNYKKDVSPDIPLHDFSHPPINISLRCSTPLYTFDGTHTAPYPVVKLTPSVVKRTFG